MTYLYLALLTLLAINACLLWVLWRLPKLPDEHASLIGDQGLAERCRTGSGFGDLQP